MALQGPFGTCSTNQVFELVISGSGTMQAVPLIRAGRAAIFTWEGEAGGIATPMVLTVAIVNLIRGHERENVPRTELFGGHGLLKPESTATFDDRLQQQGKPSERESEK